MQQKTGLGHRLYRWLASLQLTLLILLTLATGSIIGTLLPQGLDPHQLEATFGPTKARLIALLGLHDLYHTGWFRLLLVLLCVNLIVCSLERLPKTLKLIERREHPLEAGKLLKFSSHVEMEFAEPWAELQPRLERIIGREFSPVKQIKNPEAYNGMAEKGRWSRLVVYLVHLSVLVVLLGALVGSVFGFKGSMNIMEERSENEVQLLGRQEVLALPFTVRCDRFHVSFYDTGAPREFRSDLTIIEDGREVLKGSILMNDPLTYRGITFYQASYGSIAREAEVELLDADSGKSHRLTLASDRSVTLPGTNDHLQIYQLDESFYQFGRALVIAIFAEGKPPKGVRILADQPDFHGNRIGDWRVKVLRIDKSYFTGLQVKRDPGVWIVYAGFIALLIAITVTFYSNHRKLWIWADGANPTTRVILAANAKKNTLAFEDEFHQLCERLRQELESPEELKHS